MHLLDGVKAVSKLLKARFPNLTVEETIDLSSDIMRALEEQQNADAQGVIGRNIVRTTH